MAIGSQPRWTVRTAATQVDIDVGLRDYMLRIYNYMASASGADRHRRLRLRQFRHGTCQIARTPLIWLVMLAPLGLVMLLSFGINRMSAAAAQGIFWAYAGADGAVAGLDLPGLYRRQHRPRVLHHRRHLRGDEPLRLHDASAICRSSARSCSWA